MNVTRAAAGEVPRCDGTSPGCLRLTTRLWMGGGLIGPVHPYAHEFHGDTLVFYADAVSAPARTHRGPVYAWRPGWAQPRRISSDRALVCWVHDRGGAVLAHCLEDLFGDPTNAAVSPPSFELRAGPIADADGVVLPSLGRIRANRSDGLPAWQTGFSPDGQLFAFSSADPDPAVETLRVVPTAELGRAAPRELARDAGRWEISRDGRRVYFLRQEAPAGDALYVADFPSGANPTRLDPRVADFIFPGDEGAAAVGFTSNLSQPGQSRGAFRLLREPGAGVITVFAFEGVLESVRVSRDLRFTAWADEDFHARVVRNADLASCELNADRSRPAYGPTFLAGGGLVFWAEDAGGDREHRDGYLADPDGCRGKRRFAQSLQFVAPVGDRGVVFADEVDDDTQRSNLKYAAIGAGSTWPAEGAVRIHDDIDGSSVSAASLEPLLLLFRVSPGGPAKEGTYLFGPVPF
jgi:hypothetical protein